jgi:hypothetical protein
MAKENAIFHSQESLEKGEKMGEPNSIDRKRYGYVPQ